MIQKAIVDNGVTYTANDIVKVTVDDLMCGTDIVYCGRIEKVLDESLILDTSKLFKAETVTVLFKDVAKIEHYVAEVKNDNTDSNVENTEEATQAA